MSAGRGVAQNEKCLLTELADGSGVLLHLETKFYYTLNATGVEVWKALVGGATTEAEIAREICEEFDVTVDAATSDVSKVLAMMLSEGLVREIA